MNTLPVAAAAADVALAAVVPAQAAEYGVVVSKSPMHAVVAQRSRQCADQEAGCRQTPSSRAGALIGDRVETQATPAASAVVRKSQALSRVESRVFAWDVAHDCNGRRDSARLPAVPDDRVALNLAPVGVHGPAPDEGVPAVSSGFGWGRHWH
jgi:hypothetical protein